MEWCGSSGGGTAVGEPWWGSSGGGAVLEEQLAGEEAPLQDMGFQIRISYRDLIWALL